MSLDTLEAVCAETRRFHHQFDDREPTEAEAEADRYLDRIVRTTEPLWSAGGGMTDPYFRNKLVNVRDENGVFTAETEPWRTVDEFEQCCDLLDAFQGKLQHHGAWTAQGYFDMLAWGETQETHRAIACTLLESGKRKPSRESA